MCILITRKYICGHEYEGDPEICEYNCGIVSERTDDFEVVCGKCTELNSSSSSETNNSSNESITFN